MGKNIHNHKIIFVDYSDYRYKIFKIETNTNKDEKKLHVYYFYIKDLYLKSII